MNSKEYLAHAIQEDAATPIAAIAFLRKRYNVNILGSEARKLWSAAQLLSAGKLINIKDEVKPEPKPEKKKKLKVKDSEPPFKVTEPEAKKKLKVLKRKVKSSEKIKAPKAMVPPKSTNAKPVEETGLIKFDSKTKGLAPLSDYFPSVILMKLEDGTNHYFTSALAAYYYFLCEPSLPNKEKLLTSLDSRTAAYHGSERGGFESIDVDDVYRRKLISKIAKAKFTQNLALKQLLLSLDGTFLYTNTFDSFLGTGKDGKGANTIGKVLNSLQAHLAK